MDISSFVPSAFAGYYALDATTHPLKSKIRQRMPQVRLKNVQVLPVFQIKHKQRVIWVHHWLSFSALLIVSAFVTNAFLDSAITRGFLVGGILQGLKFSDRFAIYNRNEIKDKNLPN